MTYQVTGKDHLRLEESYRRDSVPFPTDPTIEFPGYNSQRREVRLLKRLMFPRCWNAGSLVDDPSLIEQTIAELGTHFQAGISSYADTDPEPLVNGVITQLPEIRTKLKQDVEAAYKGDPAAKSYVEVIRSYPGFQAILIHRVAHALYECGAEEYSRELSEQIHNETGIDIHPGATIGEFFFIDHATGVVIGETATVGDWVRIYQDVTLGALHFEESEDDAHQLQKGYKRHPNIGDHVVIGAGAKVLGPITVGDHVSIGANCWISEDIPDDTTVFISSHPEQEQKTTNR